MPSPSRPTPARGPLPERAREERRLALRLCAPAALLMGAVTGWPIAHALWLSLQRHDLRFPEARAFVGLSNYADVLSSPLWWTDLATTLLLTGVSVALELGFGLALALCMHRALVARRLVRASVLVPYGIVTVVAALAWRFAFEPATGFVNAWLGVEHAWFGDRWSALAVIVAAEVWKTTPFLSLLLLAGLTLVPQDLERAAQLDGAGAWRRFFRITLPLMKPTIAVALLFRSVDAFRIFDSVFVMTRGSAGTETLSILAYQQLLGRLNLGVGSAISVLVFLLALGIAALWIRGFGLSLTVREAGR